MSHTDIRKAKDQRDEQTRRQFLGRVAAMAAVFVGLGTMGEAAGQAADWSTLGGVLSSDPVVGTNLGGRLEVFALGADRALWHRWQVTPGGAWN